MGQQRTKINRKRDNRKPRHIEKEITEDKGIDTQSIKHSYTKTKRQQRTKAHRQRDNRGLRHRYTKEKTLIHKDKETTEDKGIETRQKKRQEKGDNENVVFAESLMMIDCD